MRSEESIRLIVLRGVEGKREYVLKGDRLVIGAARTGASTSGEPPDLAVDAPGILPCHAVLTRSGESYLLEAGPGASVVVNRRPFGGGVLHDGDQIALGGALFQYWMGGLKGGAPRVDSPANAPSGRALAAPPAPRSARRPAPLLAAILVAAAIAVAVSLLWLVRSAPLGPNP